MSQALCPAQSGFLPVHQIGTLPRRLAERRVSYQGVNRCNWNSKVPTCTVQALVLPFFWWGMTCPHLKLNGFFSFAFCCYSFCFPQSFSFCFLVFRFSWCFLTCSSFFLWWGMTCPHLKLIGFFSFAFCCYSFCFPQSFSFCFLVFRFSWCFLTCSSFFLVRYDLSAFKTDRIF